jgi:ABC-type dipeptide/oligopeptide/nickel transport system permease component
VSSGQGAEQEGQIVRRADYVIKRGFFALVTIFVAITLNFFLFRVLPGNAVTDLARVPHASPQLRHALTIEFGLDKPKWLQYLIYLRELAHGNMGVSFATRQPVWNLLFADLKNTIPLVTIGTIITVAVGVATGVLSAWRRGSVSDHVSTNAAIFAYAFPTQWLGMMLLIIFASSAIGMPDGGMTNPFLLGPEPFWQHLGDVSTHMILPAATLVLTAYGSYTLVVRSSLLETLGEDYILTARAKGLPVRRIVWVHAVRNALLPMVTLMALDFGYIVGGALLIEVIFTWPGIGQAMYQAITQRDYPVLQGGFLVLTVSVIVLNLLSDLLYFRLDPRIR